MGSTVKDRSTGEVAAADRGRGTVVVVGGSLSGLATAVALARRGVGVTVLERTAGTPQGGSGLWVDRALLRRVAGRDPSAAGAGVPVFSGTWPDAASWTALHEWLRETADWLTELTTDAEPVEGQ